MTVPALASGALDRSDPASFPDWFKTKKPRANLIVAPFVPAALVGLPVLVLFAIVVYPTVWMFYHSVHDTNMMRLFSGTWSFVGLENFRTVLNSDRFWSSMEHLAVYLTFGACLQVLLGAALALILYECVKSNALRAAILIVLVLPMMLPPSIVGWQTNSGIFKNFETARNHLDAGLKNVEVGYPQFFWEGAPEYADALGRNISKAISGQLTSQQALDEAANEWVKITQKLGLDKQTAQYKSFVDGVRTLGYKI